MLIRNHFHELPGRLLLLGPLRHQVERCLIGQELFLPMPHGIMDSLPGNMEMAGDLRQRQILIIVQVQTVSLPVRQKGSVLIQEFPLFLQKSG